MLIRIEWDGADTKVLLQEIVRVTVLQNERIAFLCEPGRGGPAIQAVRTRLARHRASMKARQKKMRHFRLHHSVHTETHDGKRKDCVVVWSSKTETQRMAEKIEDMLGHGGQL